MLKDVIETSASFQEEIGKTLSPAEQKQVLGGVLVPPPGGCATSECSVYDGATATTYYGSCGFIPIPGQTPPAAYCECVTELGYYNLPDGKLPACTVL
jgi:hypothetical protein